MGLQATYKKEFDALSPDEMECAYQQAEEEWLLAYLFVHNSSSNHNKLKNSLKEDFAKGMDNYAEDHPQTLHLLDKFTNNQPRRVTLSEGASFATTSQDKKPCDYNNQENWKNKFCIKCDKKGHLWYAHKNPKFLKRSGLRFRQ